MFDFHEDLLELTVFDLFCNAFERCAYGDTGANHDGELGCEVEDIALGWAGLVVECFEFFRERCGGFIRYGCELQHNIALIAQVLRG